MVGAEEGEEVEVREALELPGWLERLVVCQGAGFRVQSAGFRVQG